VGFSVPDGQEEPTAVSQLPYTGAKIAEWLLHREKATLEDAGKGA
jgi:hypothetical protein